MTLSGASSATTSTDTDGSGVVEKVPSVVFARSYSDEAIQKG
jgi:hypothetical protein